MHPIAATETRMVGSSYNRMSATRDAKIRDAEEGTIDPFLKTISFWDGESPLLALSAYASHPMSYYGKGGVSADFVGMARRRRQADAPGVFQIYASGCSGNVTAGKYNDGDPDNRLILADRMHAAMKRGLEGDAARPHQGCRFSQRSPCARSRELGRLLGGGTDQAIDDDPKPFGQCLAALGLSWRKRVGCRQANRSDRAGFRRGRDRASTGGKLRRVPAGR